MPKKNGEERAEIGCFLPIFAAEMGILPI